MEGQPIAGDMKEGGRLTKYRLVRESEAPKGSPSARTETPVQWRKVHIYMELTMAKTHGGVFCVG